MPEFKDLFSQHADLYAQFRPQYPHELFAFLSGLTTQHDLAWDCGTGNGQAAIGLTAFYNKIIATDPSADQLQNRLEHAQIDYRIATAENSGLNSHSVDLLTVANAIHWFNFDLFYKEVHRIVKYGGVIAAWTVSFPFVHPEADEIVRLYHNVTLDAYWLPENRMVERGYIDLPFPFPQIPSPDFIIEKMMTADDMTGYLKTWSATQKFIREKGFDPTISIRENFLKIWGSNQNKLPVRFNIILKVGRVE